MEPAQFNEKLGHACQACGSSCCKQGKLFLQRDEHRAMRAHLVANLPEAVAEFDARCEDHGNFQIYEQSPGCQFLDARNLCTLHNIGLKPAECFWWPYHVYANKSDELEVRISRGCCNAFQFHEPSCGYADKVVNEAREIGYDVLRAFREAFPGRCPSVLVQQIESVAPPGELDRLSA